MALFVYRVILHVFCRLLLTFSKNYFFKYPLRNTNSASTGLDPGQTRQIEPDLDSNCLQMLSSDTKKLSLADKEVGSSQVTSDIR